MLHRTVLAAAAVAGFGAVGRPAFAQGAKVTKAVAEYQRFPNNGERCGRCLHYQFPFGCALVEGPVSFHGWCRFYRARA
jgi:hypothetical protein